MNYDVLKSKSSCFLVNKNIRTKRNRKWKIPHTVLERQTLRFSSYKNCKLKLWLVGAHGRKKRPFFVPFILSEGNSFNIWVLSQCRVYWIHFQKICIFTYQKTLLNTLFSLFLKLYRWMKKFVLHCNRYTVVARFFNLNLSVYKIKLPVKQAW